MKVEKICRVCGKKYEACNTKAVKNTFRWQEVACSPECGSEYLRMTQIARGKLNEEPQPTLYNEDYNGFEGELEEEYVNEFGEDE